ncbi:MAG: hypothetical protein FD133_49 [Erysipelotrichaceae bacterium]|nr:MAG: hypothetical protein FD179_260 [Erysipelotrichaceae bacterium]TXT19930.1 MAG: hypothetical protein FD133_49 [Erysipelotrichaceae bacterium]
MKQNLEIEYKILISHDQYKQLSEQFIGEKGLQTNFYYDTFDYKLRQQHISCRIRTINDQSELTFKTPGPVGKNEFTFEHIDPQSVFTQADVLAFLSQLDVNSALIHQGTLQTVRTNIHLNHGLLCLDENTYNGITDYELEYEVNEDEKKGFAEFNTLLTEIDLVYISNCDSKIKRCLSTQPQLE